MALPIPEFIRRFLMHVLPQGFHRIRHGACPGLDPGVCSPTADAPATSPVPANCSPCRPPRPMTPRPPMTRNHRHSPSLAHTAADS
jgi:hypothetical protein